MLFDLSWKSAAIAGAALLVLPLLKRRAAGERVALLRAVVVALSLLPLLAVAGPVWTVAALPASAPVQPLVSTPSQGSAVILSPVTAAAFGWISALYTAGVVGILLHLVLGWLALRSWSRAAEAVQDSRWDRLAEEELARQRLTCEVRLKVSRHVATPLSWGMKPAWILLDPATAASVERARAVLAHELAHIRGMDWPVLLLSRLALALLWFNPLVWLVVRRLAAETELAADEVAIRHVSRVDYAQTLLSLAGTVTRRPACAMAVPRNGLARRVLSVLDTNRARPASPAVCASMLALAALAPPLAAMQLVRAPAAMVTDDDTGTVRAESHQLPSSVEFASAPSLSGVAERRTTALSADPGLRGVTEDDALLSASVATVQRHAGHAPIARHPARIANGPAKAATSGSEAQPDDAFRLHGTDRTAENGARNRDLPLDLAGAARQMRLRAQRLEQGAADPSATIAVRRTNPVTASSLRQEADRIDVMARRARTGAGI